MTRTLLVTLSLLIGLTTQCLRAGEDWALGIEQLHRLDVLPQIRRSIEVGSVSSYDRSGGNDDGFSGKYSFVAREADGLVIADLKGPGIIYRIWTPTPTEDIVEFYFDGESDPRIRVRFRDLFTGDESPFISPLVGYGAGGFYSYVPLTYSKSCKVLVRSQRVQFYQINYARYPNAAPIESWQASASDAYRKHQEKAMTLFASSGSDISKHVVPADSGCTTHQTSVSLQAGGTATLFETDSPGRIAGLRIAPAAALAGKARDLLLRIRWDDDEQPAVLCPAGDFFGYAWGQPATRRRIGAMNEWASSPESIRSTKSRYKDNDVPIDLSLCTWRSMPLTILASRDAGSPLHPTMEPMLSPANGSSSSTSSSNRTGTSFAAFNAQLASNRTHLLFHERRDHTTTTQDASSIRPLISSIK